jgi:hypothetical protein
LLRLPSVSLVRRARKALRQMRFAQIRFQILALRRRVRTSRKLHVKRNFWKMFFRRKKPNTLYYKHKLPTAKQLGANTKQFPIEEILLPIKDKEKVNISFNLFDISGIEKSADISALATWLENIQTLTFDASYAFGFMLFYFQEGIPDDPIQKSPGDQGQSVQFFPKFNGQNFFNQSMFRFYAELTISKIFSTLDNLATVFLYANNKYDISSEESHRKYFHTAVPFITNSDPTHMLFPLESIIKDARFEKAKDIRNDIIHNRTPLKFSSRLRFPNTPKQRTFGFDGQYIQATEVLNIIQFLINDVLKPATILAGKSIE